MNLQWQRIETSEIETINKLSQELTVPPILANIFFQRGIETLEDAKDYFRAGLEDLYDPFLMLGMEAAVDRVLKALKYKEKILIYGDYDVDGITSTSMLVLIFRKLGHDVEYYIPNRLNDGYGLSCSGIDQAKSQGIDLIITVDCGITAVNEVQYAREAGIDVIISDHHQTANELPNALAILDPKRPNCPYPFKELAGVGVAFKLMQGVIQKCGMDPEFIYPYLDFVAIGSSADIVPLMDENRILTRAGLEQLNRTENLGLKSLLRNTNLLGKTLGTGQIIFIMAPRINAVGRMGDAMRAVKMLTSSSAKIAQQISDELEQSNRERRSIDEQTFNEAVEMIESNFNPEKDSFFVLSSENWHQGVIGIVASRLVERYYRPTVMISTDNGIGKGSARSIHGFNIYDALESCTDLMLAFGGHKYAAGLSINSNQIETLRNRLNGYASEYLTDEMLVPSLTISGEIRLSDIDDKFLRVLKMMAPFGPQNSRPVFSSKGIKIVGTPTIVGNNHLRFRASQDNVAIDAIGFNLGDLIHRLHGNTDDVEIAYYIEENEWQGRISTQLRIRDIR
ncbi:MAG: single-stranded-DNA-specific exonuclease RecJ [Deferribacteres bacterium]|nr:single-stranded-DNA-specific exonuclease RecJ [candidate division KSB1 bacterium]MCB9501192.1 single-stranded-DNA-specific exonuclease RecJ [Deferribacteres bacterium]